MKKNGLKTNAITLPILFLGLTETTRQIIIWVLIAIIIIILLIYISYLFLKRPVKKHKDEKTHTVINHTVVETKKEVIKDPVIVDEKPKVEEKIAPIVEAKEEVLFVEKKEPLKVVDEIEEVNIQDGLKIRYNYSFKGRMHQAPIESQLRFAELKNYILSYPNVEVKESWKYQRFMHNGKPILKAWIHGNNLKLYFNLDPKAYKDSKYNMEDVSYAKMHETTPALFMVNGPRLLEYAKELVDIYMEGKEQKGALPHVDYTEKFISRDDLIKMKLVKVNYQ